MVYEVIQPTDKLGSSDLHGTSDEKRVVFSRHLVREDAFQQSRDSPLIRKRGWLGVEISHM
jgi:hypothetical protein